jgi:hypothetical protein
VHCEFFQANIFYILYLLISTTTIQIPVNMVPTGPPTILDAVAAPIVLSDSDKKGIERGKKFGQEGSAYSAEHRTRPATIGYAVASSPVALLAW